GRALVAPRAGLETGARGLGRGIHLGRSAGAQFADDAVVDRRAVFQAVVVAIKAGNQLRRMQLAALGAGENVLFARCHDRDLVQSSWRNASLAAASSGTSGRRTSPTSRVPFRQPALAFWL